MATIITRAGKGSPLENDEVDANFTNLNNDKVETSALNELVDDRVSTLIVPGLGITTDYDDTAGTLTVESDTIEELCKNGTGSTILKGTPVYQTGTSGVAMVIAPADASSAATMPAVGVLSQDLAAEAEGSLILMGRISGVDTSSFSEGDVIYVASGGGYTNTRPTGESVLVQNLGRVTKVNATNGGGVVMGSGRANDVPNLTDGNIFIGNASGTYDKRAIVTADISDLTATATELNYTNGVTSSIQTQLDSKAPLASPTFTGTVTIPAATVTGDVSFGDNDKAVFGAGNDLQIYHDGSNSYIKDTGTGRLALQSSSDFLVSNTANTQNYIYAQESGYVRLYYSGSTKLATTSTGIDVTGTATMDGLTVTGTTDATEELARFGNSTGAQELIIEQQGTSGYAIKSSVDLRLHADYDNDTSDGGSNIEMYTDGTQRMSITGSTGDISFYEDTGTTPKFFWDASAESLGIGTASPSAKLDVEDNSTYAARIGSSSYYWELGSFGASSPRLNAVGTSTSAIFSINGSEKMRITSSGNVGIGTNNPPAPLSIEEVNASVYSPTSVPPYSVQLRNDSATTGSISGIRFVSENGSGGAGSWVIGTVSTATSFKNNLIFHTRTGASSYAERMLIDTSGNVGIGTSSPDQLLHISALSNPTLRIENTDTTAAVNQTIGKIEFEGQDASTNASGVRAEIEAQYGGVGGTSRLIFKTTAESSTTLSNSIFLSYNTQAFYTGNTERMRIDSSGNLLVGKTAVDNTTVGIRLDGGLGLLSAVRDGAAPLLGVRKSSDGDIVEFRKDTTTVGSIGVFTGGTTTYIDGGATHTGLVFGSSALGPRDAGTTTDGTVDLGSTGGRFKDLYLSGTAYVGTRVGIGNAAPQYQLDLNTTGSNTLFGSGISASTSGGPLNLNLSSWGNSGGRSGIITFTTGSTTNGSERVRIDASGNLLVGKTANNVTTAGVNLNSSGYVSSSVSSNPAAYFNRGTSDGNIAVFLKDGTTVGIIGVGSVPSTDRCLTIGKSDSGILFDNIGNRISPWNMNTNAVLDNATDLGYSGGRFKDLYLSGTVTAGGVSIDDDNNYSFGDGTTYIQGSGAADRLKFITNASEAMRIDASGNLLVGKTVQGIATSGVELTPNDRAAFTKSGGAPILVNRTSNDGEIINLRKDGTTVGSILNDGTAAYFNSTADGGLARAGTVYFKWSSAQFYPNVDDSSDLGIVSRRFDDIYATNATIQTSDSNEKQDIESLSDAETRVAVACKGLLRKFRWKSAVEEKGDDARIHFGIIAQDLQAAFEAEGLDAGRYAMFIHSTWTDEETGEERSRMGVRYSELLAFIIAAL